MNWFEGTIPSAIQTSKSEGKLLIIYINGVDDVSQKMNDSWNNEEVAKLCKEDCIALKVEAKSETCVQFSQIYPVVIVPSTYFIGNQGVPIEVVGGHVEADEFAGKIQQIIQISKAGFHKDSNQSSQPATENLTQSTNISMSNSEEGSSGIAENTNTISTEEKVAKAEQLIEQRRRQKLKEAEDKALNEEMQRRKMGKDAAQLKQWQADKEREEIASTWKKERDEDKLHKEKVKQQIARDRAERQAKFQKEKEERQLEQEKTKEAKLTAAAKASSEAEAVKRESTRLQFRLPDGSSVTETFASSETLGTARMFLKNKIGEIYGNFSIIVTFPRRQFTEDDMSKSLLDLQLVPSAALIILPGGKTSKNSSDGGNNGGIIMLILSPLVLLWNFIYAFLFGAAPTTPQPDRSQAQGEEKTLNSSQSKQEPAAATSIRNRTQQSQADGLGRQEGNIRRFRNIQDDDDENSTYNGNSTQQM